MVIICLLMVEHKYQSKNNMTEKQSNGGVLFDFWNNTICHDHPHLGKLVVDSCDMSTRILVANVNTVFEKQ